jgi:hypothetical protein
VRGRSVSIGAEAVANVGDERALVNDGMVLRLKAEVREVAAVRRQRGEGESQCGGE